MTIGKELGMRMDKTLRFWIDCSYEARKPENQRRPKAEVIAEILQDCEKQAMRRLDGAGRLVWKATPQLLSELADAESEANQDLADVP